MERSLDSGYGPKRAVMPVIVVVVVVVVVVVLVVAVVLIAKEIYKISSILSFFT